MDNERDASAEGERRSRHALDELERKLAAARTESRISPPPRPPVQNAGLALGMRVAVEMVAGVGVGAALGYGLDRWLGTSPWLLIVFFFVGAGAGAVNTYRAIAGAGFGNGRADGNGGKPPPQQG